tara:strand:+ start:895 stop:1401 length:507 start_codon:yes stop_codon:yes gene_type:complete
MKKFLLTFITLTFTLGMVASCVNPSMEEGLESLESALAELEAQILLVDIDKMKTDVATMQSQVEQMEVDIAEYNASVEDALAQMADIKLRLEGILETVEEWATDEQVQNLLAQVQEVSEGIDMLVFIADYDYDGVMNGFDQCPDTPITEINNVNGVGCAPGQTPISGD